MRDRDAEAREERKRDLEALYEDIRRAMSGRQFDLAARLSLQLSGELARDEYLMAMHFPVCIECNGYAEVVDPEHPEKRALCVTVPQCCPGNKHGRMSPEQHAAYLEAKLKPRVPTMSESVPHPEKPGGEVARLPRNMEPLPTGLAPERIGPVVDEHEAGKERPPLVQS